MYVCIMYICIMCLCMYVSMYVCMYVCVCMYVSLYVLCMYVRKYVCMFVCMYAFMYVTVLKLSTALKCALKKKNNCQFIYDICVPTSYEVINTTDNAPDFKNETAFIFRKPKMD
jgi:hypothetical protein